VDVLSDVLLTLRLNGAVFYNAEFSCPWSIRSPESSSLTPWIRSSAGHVIVYHLLIAGEAWARLEGEQPVNLAPGDIVMFPNGDPHLMGNGAPAEIIDNETQLNRIFAQGLEVARMGGGGEVTHFVCGYLTCDRQGCDVLLSGLPRLLKISIRSDPQGEWLEDSIRFAVGQARLGHAGSEALLAKLSEALFIETLRRHIAGLPDSQTGWMAGTRDPHVGKALACFHREPARPWTLADLATEVGVSRTVLAERFRHFLGEPPMAYLTRWRMQLGARLLTATNHSVAEVAAMAGYDSEAAFNRAFKRQFGTPPARFRRIGKSEGGPGAPLGATAG
jgi:AraC-like DNA-binding protein